MEVRCWGIELRVAESDWEGALRAIEYVMSVCPLSGSHFSHVL